MRLEHLLSGESLICKVSGATVVVRGTTNGTLTDSDGKFSLKVKQGDILMFSFMGLRTQSLTVADSAPLTVLLNEDIETMDELMVVGLASDGEGVPSKTYPDKKVVSVVDVPKEPEAPENQVFTVVEEMPRFPGGMEECQKFLAKNLNYPVELQKAKVEGRVIAQFVVGKDGSLNPDDIKVVQTPDNLLSDEVVRVVKASPQWEAGTINGKSTRVKYTIPIVFNL